ncbi:hypothetical protein GS907_07270 [Rhodococcus hoagii]|nr:hypothetical protein [Prescottella equi]
MSTAEQIIAAHRLKYKRTPARHLADTGVAYAACAAPDCDWSYDYATAGAEAAHAAHVVAALTNAGKTIVDLPEHVDEALEEHGITASRRSLLPITLQIDPGSGHAVHYSVKCVRDFAAALLAAARVAEGGDQP